MKFKKLKKYIKYKQLIAIDTEDDSKGNLISICVYDSKKFYIFKNNVDFIDFILSYKFNGKLYVVCTNLEYDIVNLFKGFYKMLEFNYGNRLISVKLKGRKIYFFDTLNHFFISVKKQGEYIGLKKLDFAPDNIEYNKRDTEITYKFMDNYQKFLNELGADLNFTIASTCMNLFRRKFLNDEIKKIPNKILDFLKKGYYGGRCEIFTMKVKSDNNNKIYYYDINSLYPYVMKNYNLPCPDIYKISKELYPYGMYYARIKYINKDYLGYLPYRIKGKLYFPIGEFKSVWTGYELVYGIENKIFDIIKIYEGIKYEKSKNYFYNYIDYLYNLRLKYKNDKFKNFILKMLMNSLYGKFAEKVNVKNLIVSDDDFINIVDKYSYYPIHSNVIMSSYITAIARTLLYENLRKILDTGQILCYCDTDSIIYKGKEGILKVSDNIGDFKLENVYKEAEFILPKMYILIDYNGQKFYKAKGVMSEYAEKFFNDNIISYKKPVKIREYIKRIDKTYKPNVWNYFIKKNISNYDKRIIIDNYNTLPVYIIN